MRVALAQINPTVGDLEGNADLITRWMQQAGNAGADLVAFPELAISGYPPEDLVLKDHFLAGCRRALDRVAAACDPAMVGLVGVPLQEKGEIYNAVAVVWDGEVRGWAKKMCLPNYAVFDEKRYFAAGRGLFLLRALGASFGLTVCEDIWVEGGPAEAVALAGATVIVNQSMSPYYEGRGHERQAVLSKRAARSRAFICYVNGIGGQDELVFDGQSLVFGPDGALLARAAQFEEDLLIVDLDPGAAEAARADWERSESDQLEESQALCGSESLAVEVFDIERETAAGPAQKRNRPSATMSKPVLREPLAADTEVYEALCLGVKDYTLKNGFKQVVMGISGGIDSALTCCIAADALGRDKVNAVSMPSRYSSSGTKSDARETAERIGAHYYEIPIETLYGSYLETLKDYLDAGHPGLAEQNIQARIRGNLLMALSNKYGWLVLTTGNKSEAAVGYATLYGDMAGGFGVLKDVPKTLVYRLAVYRNALGAGEGPIPASTIDRAPSAELAADQKDQDTLPPYDVLDRIIEAYVVDDASLEEIVRLGIARETVQRVVAMIDGNEYKRRQAAPGVRITPKAFGKDRRLPITNRYRG